MSTRAIVFQIIFTFSTFSREQNFSVSIGPLSVQPDPECSALPVADRRRVDVDRRLPTVLARREHFRPVVRACVKMRMRQKQKRDVDVAELTSTKLTSTKPQCGRVDFTGLMQSCGLYFDTRAPSISVFRRTFPCNSL